MWAKQRGFTIVEILIVIVVIAILASIVVISFRTVQQRTQETSVRNDLKNMAEQVELARLDLRRYPTVTQLTTMGIAVNKKTYGVNPTGATIFYCVNHAGTSFSFVARVKTAMVLKFSSADGQVSSYSGDSTAPQLCLDSGVEGTTTTVYSTPFTVNGSWNSWVREL